MTSSDAEDARPSARGAAGRARRVRSGARATATVADVARLAGVSSAVVSYVVNSGPRPVAAATRDRVLRAIDTLGYRPNAAAQALKRGATSTIGLAVPNNTNPYFAELARLVEMAAEVHGYETIFVNASDDADRERRHLQKFLARRIDGLLLASAVSDPDLDEVMDSGTKVVLLDRAGPYSVGATTIDAVGVDYRGASRALVHHLLDHGHDEIALVAGDERLSSSRARENGWSDAIDEAGRRRGPIVRAPYSRPGGYEAGQRLLRDGRFPRAVFASSDQQAVGVLRAVHEAGLSVPQDVALVSFDGTVESEYAWPPLTAMRQPVELMARTAVDLLLEQVPMTGGFRAFDAELVVRASCGCGG